MKRRFIVEFDWDDDSHEEAHAFQCAVLGCTGDVRVNGWQGDAKFVIALPSDYAEPAAEPHVAPSGVIVVDFAELGAELGDG